MAVVIVTTDDGREVWRCNVPDDACEGDLAPGPGYTMIWSSLVGSPRAPSGGLGRALVDAQRIQAGQDPERLSEKVMRILRQARPHEWVNDGWCNNGTREYFRCVNCGLGYREDEPEPVGCPGAEAK